MSNYENLDYLYYLAHSGRKGMKWYQHVFAKIFKRHGDVVSDHSNDSIKYVKKRSVSDMSDEDLQRSIRRLQMERQWQSMQPVSKGRAISDACKSIAVNAIKNSAQNAANKIVQNYADNALDKILSKSEKNVMPDISKMTIDELKEFNSRRAMEEQYKKYWKAA